MHHKENIEAGCQQCHVKEIVTEMAPDAECRARNFPSARLHGLPSLRRLRPRSRRDFVGQPEIRQLEQQKAEWKRQIGFDEQKANNPRTSDAEAKKLFQEANDLKVRSSGLDAKIEQLDMRSESLVREVKKVGPSLKEVRMKLKKEWIPVWLKDPHNWREGTKMPTFRLDDGEIQAIAAFIWQSGVTGSLPTQKPGDPVKGKEAFETRGCMACHSMGEGGTEAGRHVRRESEPRRREGQLRLPRPLGPQSAAAHFALLRVRKEGHRPRTITSATGCPSSPTWNTPNAPTTGMSCRCSR